MSEVHYTPTEKKILKVLEDGYPHTRKEIHACLWDEMGALSNIRVRICYLRKKLRPQGFDILCEITKTKAICYRQVRLIGSAYNGYR